MDFISIGKCFGCGALDGEVHIQGCINTVVRPVRNTIVREKGSVKMTETYKLGWTWNPFKQRFEHQHKDGYLIFTDMNRISNPFKGV